MTVDYAPATTMPTALGTFIESERRRADVAGTAVIAFDRGGIRFDGYVGYANRATGEALPGLSVAQDVSHFHETAAQVKSLDEAAQKHAEEAARKAAEAAANPAASPQEVPNPN